MKTILITGASGLIGKHLTSLLLGKGYRVIHLSRNASLKDGIETFVWDVNKRTIDDTAVYQADYIIHLAGAAVADHKWTEERKKEIISSRTGSILLLYESLKRNNKKLNAFISASAAGIYGAVTQDKIFSENDLPANDFLGISCRLWEESVNAFIPLGIRTVKVRVGIVLAKNGGALSKLAQPVKFGIGSALGSGKQYIPWIHVDDICGIFLKAIEDETMVGVYNAVAPEHITNNGLTKAIAKMLHKPYFFPQVPSFILKMLFGKEMAAMFLEGSRVSSEKIQKAGYVFKYRKVEGALKDLLVK